MKQETEATVLAFLAHPDDYMIDHEMTSRLVRTACFGAPARNVLAMKRWAEHRGQQIGAAFGEGFWQHKGHAYPQNDLLGELLNGRRHDNAKV